MSLATIGRILGGKLYDRDLRANTPHQATLRRTVRSPSRHCACAAFPRLNAVFSAMAIWLTLTPMR
jgi:hypothetical protein